MKKQFIQLGMVVVVLVLLIGGYFGISKYYESKEKKSSSKSITAFELSNYKDITGFTYVNSSKQITLLKTGEQWYNSEDSSVNIDNSTVENSMLAQLAEVIASKKIETPKDLSDYGFTKSSDNKITASTNTIVLIDGDNKTYTVYIGDQNAYDTSQYYMMIEGDDNVYVVDNKVPDAFSKSIDDIKVEETTVATTVQEEVTTEVDKTTQKEEYNVGE